MGTRGADALQKSSSLPWKAEGGERGGKAEASGHSPPASPPIGQGGGRGPEPLGGSIPGAPPCPRLESRPGVRTRVGALSCLPQPPLCGAGAVGRVPVRPQPLPPGGAHSPNPPNPPNPQPRLQICVSCTFSLEPLLKSRGSWMELRPGGPLPPQPPPLGLLL